MPNNVIIEALTAAFALEIANPYWHTTNTLTLAFPDGTTATIAAQRLSHSLTERQKVLPPLSAHSYHYVHQHDFGYGADPERIELNRLQLLSVEDCLSYITDVCETLLNAQFQDFEITLPDQRKYLLTVTY